MKTEQKLNKKLTLNKETVRLLSDAELTQIAGAATRANCVTNTCDTCLVINCERSGNCISLSLGTIIY